MRDIVQLCGTLSNYEGLIPQYCGALVDFSNPFLKMKKKTFLNFEDAVYLRITLGIRC